MTQASESVSKHADAIKRVVQSTGVCLVISVIAYFLGTSWINDALSNVGALERGYWRPGVVGEAAHTVMGLSAIFFLCAGYLLKVGGLLLTPLYILAMAIRYISNSTRIRDIAEPASRVSLQEPPGHEKEQ